jgi:hypothetical protein
MKRCADCGETKPLEDFSPFKRSKDGRFSYCRTCSAARSRAYAARNRDEVNARKQARRSDPEYRERERERDRERYREDPERAQARSRRYRERNPEKIRVASLARPRRTPEQKERRWTSDLLKRYGLSLDGYKALLVQQDGGCAICGTTEPNGPGSRFQVDHDHVCCPGSGSCGKCIRGLLCSSCNTLIGLAKEDPQRLLSAVAYLQRRPN